MDIGPTREFKEAFRRVTGIECTPRNFIFILRHEPDTFRLVEKEHARIIDARAT